MKTKLLSFAIIFSALIYGLSAQAHDPKEHMQDAKKPDCAAMDNMDQSKMDMNDPVMQAMMKQCMQAMHEGDHDDSETPDEPEKHEKDGDTNNFKHKHK